MAIRARGGVGRIEGMKEAREALQQLNDHVQKLIGKSAVNAAADAIVPEVQARAPVSSRVSNPSKGSLKLSVHKTRARGRKGGAAVAVLADDVAAVPTEFGTSKMPAKPWFRPAVDSKREAAAQAVADTIRDEIENGPWVKGKE